MALRKITTLSQAQRDALPIAREKWLREGLSTSPAARDAVRRAVAGMYAEIGEPRPMLFWVDSPGAGAFGSMIVSAWMRSVGGGSELCSRLDERLLRQLYRELESQVNSQLDTQLVLELIVGLVAE